LEIEHIKDMGKFFMNDPYKLLIVDDSKLIRRAVPNIFKDQVNFRVVGEAGNGK